MKKSIGIVLAAVLVLASISWKNNISEEKGYIKWFAKNKFYKASGSFTSWEIKNVNYNTGDIKSLSLDVVVDVNSIEEKSDKLVNHLKEDDYFYVDLFPKATINVSNVEATDTAYKAKMVFDIKGIKDESVAYFKVISMEPLEVEGYALVDRPKHTLGKPNSATKEVKVDFKVIIPTDVEASSSETSSYNVDSDKSVIVWKGDALDGAYVHNGTIAIANGNLSINNNAISAGNFTIDMKSVRATDDNYTDKKTPQALEGHLSTGDFFDTEKYPTAKFVITKVEGTNVMGDLTIKGKTKPATIKDVSLVSELNTVTAKGKLVFNRQDFNISYKGTSDFVINDIITLDITVVATN